MKYLIRTLKFLVWFAVFFSLIVVVMALAIPEYDISTAFRFDGQGMFMAGSQWKILALFIVASIIYPALTYVKKEALTEKSFDECRPQIMGVFDNLEYTLTEETDESLVFRKTSSAARFMRMFEDKVTITKGEPPFILQGPRKDLLRIASGIESACRNL